jgi:DNA-binding response OmpR family regulator
MMPGMDGLEVCRRIRQTRQVPIIMLTARATRPTAWSAWSWGPTTTCRNRFRRASCWRGCERCCGARQPTAVETEIVIGPRRDRRRRAPRARWAASRSSLTGLEFDILLALARRPGRVVPRETLLAEAGRNDVTVNDRRSTCTCRTCAEAGTTSRSRRG